MSPRSRWQAQLRAGRVDNGDHQGGAITRSFHRRIERGLARTWGRWWWLALIAVVGALAVTGCGSDPSPQGLAPGQAQALQQRLEEARAAAARRDAAGTGTALRAFRRDLTLLARQGALSPAQAERLRAGARQAEARAAVELAPPPSPPPVPDVRATSPPAAGADPAQPGRGHDKGKGKGEGKGEGDDDEDQDDD
jgi:hypothetical protein